MQKTERIAMVFVLAMSSDRSLVLLASQSVSAHGNSLQTQGPWNPFFASHSIWGRTKSLMPNAILFNRIAITHPRQGGTLSTLSSLIQKR